MNQQLIDEVREVMEKRPEVIKLLMMVKDGISTEDMEQLVPAMKAGGISDELIEGIKLFEAKSDH